MNASGGKKEEACFSKDTFFDVLAENGKDTLARFRGVPLLELMKSKQTIPRVTHLLVSGARI